MSEPASSKPTVYVVEDDQQVRSTVVRLIEEHGFVTHAFGSAEEFVDAIPEDRVMGGPSCLVLDLRLPQMSGLELQEKLLERDIDLPTIFLTGHADVNIAVHALRRGAVDFVEKPFRAAKLITSVKEALAKHAAELDERVRAAQARERFFSLTDRERQVCRMASTGLANKEIAFELGVSPQAIDATRARAFRKLGISNVAELVRLVVRIDGDSAGLG